MIANNNKIDFEYPVISPCQKIVTQQWLNSITDIIKSLLTCVYQLSWETDDLA